MKKSIELADVFGASFVEEAKRAYPTLNEVMQYHLTWWIITEVAYYLNTQASGSTDIYCDSKGIVLRELGDCCQMIHTVCEEEHQMYRISEGTVCPL